MSLRFVGLVGFDLLWGVVQGSLRCEEGLGVEGLINGGEEATGVECLLWVCGSLGLLLLLNK